VPSAASPAFCDAAAMQVRFVTQPFADGRDLTDFIGAVAADGALHNLDVVVAWAKRSGLSRLRNHLEAIRARPATTRLIVGIDEGGATRQGLELARELFDSVHVFHDRAGRTFHSKVYAAWGDDGARVLVGSHNATAGGVYFNYEAGLECDLVLPGDAGLLTTIHKYVARLYADTTACKELTDAVLAELLANPRYRVGDEDARHKPAAAQAPEELDAEVDIETLPGPPGSGPSIFGGSAEPKKADPGAAGAAKNAAPAKKAAVAPAPPPGGVGPAGPPVVKRWFKALSHADAQHPVNANTNPTGALRLVQAGHAINQTNYFRHDLFAPLPWAAIPRPLGLLEQTVVPFAVAVNGVDLGMHNLRVDDAAYREAGQGNFTAVLHWDSLTPTLAAMDYTGYFVVLERLGDGSYRLEITPQDPGGAAFVA